jgi:translocation and assembly module TamB
VYSKDLSILPLLLSSRREAAAEEGLPLRLSVRVKLDENLAVRNRMVDLRANGTLSVEGTAAKPVVFGSIVGQEGRIVFRGHDWTVTTATVRFADPRRIEPYLDVVAECRIREYDVALHVTGPLSDLTIQLNSVPSLPRDDVLALVAFGSTRAELKDSPGAILLGEAGKVVARDLLGIDPTSTRLRVSTGTAGDASSTPHTWAGEERPSVYPSRNTPSDRKERVRIEYQLLDPVYLSGEYDREGGYGADLVLRLRFR